ncbi:PAS domain-containing protein [Prosthecobacter sp.]|uniref:PAS domain-containing protein n=1 Tax=Prosthecobacter sp. TaxID=1965333 RepID=UPI002489614B|nr:PAS domain-containing protein [Prosthecobacter sp.]MDI1313652.1 PAS domain-containing protein [Prosthecobacter sp.]
MISPSKETDICPEDPHTSWRLEDILKDEELASRPSRPPNYQADSEALVALARHMAESPKTILQKLVETALTLCGADSAGVSLEEIYNGEDIFRWRALTGRMSGFLGGTMPRNLSPCGVTVDRQAAQLMQHPVRYYPYIAGLKIPIQEVLLVPFYRGGHAVGTLWIISHDRTQAFDAEDARILGSLSQFAAAAVETVGMVESMGSVQLQLKQAQTKLESALDAGAIATWEWDILNDRLHADAYCARLFSLSLEEADGAPIQRFVDAMHPDDRAGVEQQIQAAIERDAHYEVEYRVKNGPGYRWVLARGKVLRDATGKAIHFSGVVVDITTRKQAEMERETLQQKLWDQEREISLELRQARDQAVAAARAKDDFLAALSHELRTPLNPVLLLASDMAENADYSPEVRAAL